MILAAGLSPAWQQILRFEQLHVGEVNRAMEALSCASGKVLNVGAALHHLGAESVTLSAIGGAAGQSIEAKFQSHGIPAQWIETEVPTRVCTTILDDSTGETTELVENAQPLTQRDIDEFATAFRTAAAAVEAIVISGSMPPGPPIALWRDLLAAADCPAICDFRGEELLAALQSRPFLIKPNREELAATVGRQLRTAKSLRKAMRELNERGAEWVVVTNGPRDVWMTSRNETYRFSVPQVQVENPIGCGDCLAAGIAAGLVTGRSTIQCVQFGIAAAVENARQLLPARLDRKAVDRLSKQVRVESTNG